MLLSVFLILVSSLALFILLNNLFIIVKKSISCKTKCLKKKEDFGVFVFSKSCFKVQSGSYSFISRTKSKKKKTNSKVHLSLIYLDNA